MPSHYLTIPLYAAGFFNIENPTPAQRATLQQQLEQLKGSGVTRLMLAGLNPANPDAFDGLDWNYGGNAILRGGQYVNQLDPDLPALLADLRQNGGVRDLSFSIGGGNSTSVYQAFQELFQAYGTGPANPMYGSLSVLAETLGLTSYDLDLEPSDPDLAGTITDLGVMLSSLGLGVTYSPYEQSSFWVGCLVDTYQQLGYQPCIGWHLQCYAGGLPNEPGPWIEAIRDAGSDSTGIDDPAAFVLPGFETLGTLNGPVCVPDPQQHVFSPAGFQKQLAAWKAELPGLSGCFLWQYGRILDSQTGCQPPCPGPAAYAQAIAAGLSGS